MQLCPGGYMPTLAEIYEQHAEECLRAAAKTENPKYRDMLLKFARTWRVQAEALRRGAEGAPSGPPAPTRAE